MAATKKIETRTTTIWIDDEGILHLDIKDEAEIDLEEVKKCFEIYKTLGCREERVLQLIKGGSFFTFDTEAQKYVARNGKHFFIAAAIINNSLSIRLLFNFYNKFLNHDVPFKMFGTKDKALAWLKTIKGERKN